MSAPVYRNRLTRDPARLIRCEKQDQRSDLGGLPRPPERMSFFRPREKRRVILLAHATATMKIRDRDSGIDRVDTNAMGRPVDGGTSRQVIQSALAGVVSRQIRKYTTAI